MGEPSGQLIWRQSTIYGPLEIWRIYASASDLYELWFGSTRLDGMTFPNPLYDALIRGDYDRKAGKSLSRLVDRTGLLIGD